MYLGHSVILE